MDGGDEEKVWIDMRGINLPIRGGSGVKGGLCSRSGLPVKGGDRDGSLQRLARSLCEIIAQMRLP